MPIDQLGRSFHWEYVDVEQPPNSGYYGGGPYQRRVMVLDNPATGTPSQSGTPTATAPSARSTLSGSSLNLPGDIHAYNRNAAAGAAEAGTTNAMAMASRIDPYLSDRFYENLERAFPNFEEVFGQMSANTMSMLRGELPEDVEALVRQYAAEANMQGTIRRTARDLGRTSMDLATQGFSQGSELFRIADEYLTPPTFDVSAASENIRGQLTAGGMLTPSDALSAQLQARGQDLSYAAQMAALRQRAYEFEANMDWERTISNMNLAYQNEQARIEDRRLRQIERARQDEQTAQMDLSNRYLTMLESLRNETGISSESSIPTSYNEISDVSNSVNNAAMSILNLGF